MKINKYLLFICVFFVYNTAAYSQFGLKVPKVPVEVKKSTDKIQQSGVFNTGSTVEVYDPIGKGWFRSTILKEQDGKYFIHFKNYDSKYDTWVTAESIRPIGSGNQNDPGPAGSNVSKETSTDSKQNTASNSGTSSVKGSSKSSSGSNDNSSSVSDKPGPTSFPVIYPNDPTVTFKIGDPIIYEYKEKKNVYTIADLDFNGLYKGMKCFAWTLADINLAKVELVSGYNYTRFPSTIVNGTGDKFKEGEMVECYCRATPNKSYEWTKGIVASVDGDNYFIYRPGTSFRPDFEFFWHYITDVRAIGSNKTASNDHEGGGGNYGEYLKQINSMECKLDNRWEFLWYYRHDFGTFYLPSLESMDKFKTLFDNYNCIFNVRKNFPDLGTGDEKIENRFDVQWEFLQKRKDYIRIGLERVASEKFAEFIIKFKTAYYASYLANKDGFNKFKDRVKKEELAVFEKSAELVGTSLQYPWDKLEAAYQEGLKVFTNEVVKDYDGLTYNNVKYSGKDSKAEAVAKKYVLGYYPDSKIISMGTSSEFYINKTNGMTTNRAKGVVVIHQNPNYRCCIKSYCFYQEDYAGGSFGAGHINEQITGTEYIKTCK
ncbi:MAG: agenet domain-containing protein [Bacteroidota bacterium]